LKIRRNQ